MICCFTGHRKIPEDPMLKLPELLDNEIENLILSGVSVFRCGGAIGFDTLAALKVLRKKLKYPNVRLELILPCRDQADRWGAFDRDAYKYVLQSADSVEYVSEVYTQYCMYLRNRRLVEGSDFCVAYCTSSRGGTAYTCNYAVEKGVKLINLANELQ